MACRRARQALGQRDCDEGRDFARQRPAAESGVVAELGCQQVGDARAAADQHDAVAQPFGFQQFDQLGKVVDVAAFLRDDLRRQDRVDAVLSW